MTPLPGNAAWPACLSALRLDRWMAGELDPRDAEDVRGHVSACAACKQAAESLEAARETAALPPLRLAPAPARHALRPRRVVAWAAGLAAAAALLLAVRPDAPPERTKGGAGLRLAMYVQHGDSVREVSPGEAVAPGDAVRFVVTSPAPAYVAVLSLDPAGRASIYFPPDGRAAAVAAGTDVPLPLATRLDATVGEEHVVGLFCDRAIELEPVRAALEASSGFAAPAGCEVTRWRFEKR
jgi:hypothetical protein